MADRSGPEVARLRLVPKGEDSATGIAAGTVVLTAKGALPVDYLEPGDRVVTRSGMRPLRTITARRYSGPAVEIAAGALGEGRPEQALILPAGVPVLVRGPERSRVVAVADLIEDDRIAAAEVVSLRLYDLRFDRPEIVYAEGLEIACRSSDGRARLAAE